MIEEPNRKLPKIFRLIRCRFPTDAKINPHLAKCAGIWELIGWKDLDKETPVMTMRAFHASCPLPQIEERYYPEKWITFEKIEWKEDMEFAPKE